MQELISLPHFWPIILVMVSFGFALCLFIASKTPSMWFVGSTALVSSSALCLWSFARFDLVETIELISMCLFSILGIGFTIWYYFVEKDHHNSPDKRPLWKSPGYIGLICLTVAFVIGMAMVMPGFLTESDPMHPRVL
jgi:hypothetical protein